ncbi:MAG: ABC transporter substrate-binding protein [Candidatus Bathyarchaeia archaeon]
MNQTLVDKYKFEFNLDKAKKILDDAGIIDRNGDGVRELPDGTKLGPFTIQVPYGWTDWMMMCDMISENLNKIGVAISTEFPDFSIWWQRLMDKDWDLVIGWAGATPGFAHPWNAFRGAIDPRLSHPAGNW